MDNPAYDVDIEMEDVDLAPEDDGDVYNTPKYYQSRRRRNTIITKVYLEIKTASLT